MAIKWNFWVIWAFIVVLFAVQFPGDVEAESEEKSPHRTATAVRIEGAPPQLDGVLDDEIWKTAPLHD